MAYEKQEWAGGDIIKAYNLNHIENGIYNESESAEQNASDIASNKESIEQNASDIASNKESIEQNASDIANNKEETDKAIEDLSKDVDDKYSELNSALAALPLTQTGSFNGTVEASGTVYSTSINFSQSFSSTPVVCCSCRTGTPNGAFATANQVTSTGFTLYYMRTSGTSDLTVAWVAVGAK